LIAAMSLATPAQAHANLVDTSPFDGAQVESMPSEVIVTFDEPVELPIAALRVFDSFGDRVDLGDPGHGASPEQLRVSMPADPGLGWYVATWHVISLDGHPLQGAFIFQVGAGSGDLDHGVIDEILASSGSRGSAATGAAVRFLGYAGSLIAIGASLFRLLAGARSIIEVKTLIRIAAVTGIVASALQVPVFAVESSGLGLDALTSIEALSSSLGSPVGVAALVRIAGLGLVVVGQGQGSVLLPVGVMAAVGAEVAAGHTVTTDPRWAVWLGDAVHLGAAAVWLGGLAALAVSLRALAADKDGPTGVRLVATFSRLAAWTVLALTATGLVLAWALVRAPSALTSTTFGWTLIAKVAVVFAVLGVATYNRRRLVPAVVAAETGAWGRLVRTVRIEATGLLAVLVLTAVLVNLPPAAEAAGLSGPFATTVEFGDGQLNLVVDPNRAGLNQVHAYFLDQSGLPADLGGDITFELSLHEVGIGPLVRIPNVAGPGHWILTGNELSIPGEWHIAVHRVDGFEEIEASVAVTVRP
jgi:copper transport protein